MTTLTKQSGSIELQKILKFTFGLVPIAAGADKFFNILTNWDTYIHPAIADVIPFSTPAFIMVVGIIEILAGILVLFKTEIGAYIVSAWLTLIALSLFFSGNHLDVAVRDIVMAIAAFVLARMTVENKIGQ